MLSDLLVHTGVKQAWFSAQMRLQGLHFVLLDEGLDGVVLHRVFQITENPSLAGTDFHARRLQTARDAVITEAAFLRGMSLRVHEPATVRARLDAEAAADAAMGIDQHRA